MKQSSSVESTPSNAATLFSDLDLSPEILSILDRLDFKTPTPIQHQSIPTGLEGKDIIGIAQTGTGKTLAFGLPLIQRLRNMPKGRGLVLLPTRELALQADETLRKISKPLGLSTAVLIGGASMYKQIEALRRKPRIILATPGRLIDHLKQRKIQLSDVKILVLDEADRMFDMGFAPQINEILNHVSTERQTMLYSATMPTEIVKLATSHMQLPVRIEVAPAGTTAEAIEQEIIMIDRNSKLALLETLLQANHGTVLVFSRTKHGAGKICRALNRKGYEAAEIHADRSLSQRREALDGFKRGKYRILVATDIAARGIDVTNIAIVINFDLPDNLEDYVHRIGRTGRAGRTGKAISFATPHQRRDIRNIERLIRKTLKVTSKPVLTVEPEIEEEDAFFEEAPPRTRQRRSGVAVVEAELSRPPSRGPEKRSRSESTRSPRDYGAAPSRDKPRFQKPSEDFWNKEYASTSSERKGFGKFDERPKRGASFGKSFDFQDSKSRSQGPKRSSGEGRRVPERESAWSRTPSARPRKSEFDKTSAPKQRPRTDSASRRKIVRKPIAE